MRVEFDAHEHRNASERGLNIRPVIDKHPAFRALLMWPAAFPVVVKLLGHYNIQLMQSHLFEADPGHAQRVTGWHNDGGVPAIEVNGIRAFGSLKVGYFLRAIDDENMGGLMVVPGSHRIQGAPPFRDGETDPVGGIQVRLDARRRDRFPAGPLARRGTEPVRPKAHSVVLRLRLPGVSARGLPGDAGRTATSVYADRAPTARRNGEPPGLLSADRRGHAAETMVRRALRTGQRRQPRP